MERMSKPKFIKEIEKSEGKERAKCGRWYIRVYGELDHKPMVELESLEIVVKELHKLEEENKKLKEFKTRREESMFYFKAQMERAEPKTAREAEDLQRAKEIFEKLYREELSYLEEENKKLNIKVASLEGEIKGLNYTIEKLKEENQTLELWLDRKEKLNKGYREDVDYWHHRCMVAERGGEDED